MSRCPQERRHRTDRVYTSVCLVVVALSASPLLAAPPAAGGDGQAGESVSAGPADPGSGLDTDGTVLSEEEQRKLRLQILIEQAQEAAERGRQEEAIRLYGEALQVAPRDPQARIGRAHARRAATPRFECPVRAIKDLQRLEADDPQITWLEQRRHVLEWMATCGEDYRAERLALARDIAAEPRGSLGRDDDVLVLVAELLSELGDESVDDALAYLQAYQRECKSADVKPIVRALQLEAELLQARGSLVQALDVYDELARLYPNAPQHAAWDRAKLELTKSIELKELGKEGFRPLPAAKEAVERGRAALLRRDYATAEREFTTAIGESDWYSEPYFLRGQVRVRTGRIPEAVADLEAATIRDRRNDEAHRLLGELYSQEFPGAHQKAISHFERALALRSDLYWLHFKLGQLYSENDRARAQEHYRAFIRVAPKTTEHVLRAKQAIEELEREFGEEPADFIRPADGALRALPPELSDLIDSAFVSAEHSDWLRAEEILLDARDKFPDETIVLNELARVVLHSKRVGEARQYWEQSLALDPEQGEVHERLGLLLRHDLPDQAEPHLLEASEQGSLTARFVLAELLWEQTRPFEASEQLDLYLATASEYDLHREPAEQLRAKIDRRFLQVYLVGGVVVALILGGLAWRLYGRYRGASLRRFLERQPKSFPEVVRILSLIRHEILKHNTAFLSDVGAALERDELDADQRAAVLGQRMFGDGGGTRTSGNPEIPGVYGRFLGYVDELDKVARAHRTTLNLHRKDPIFRPMIAAFEELRRYNDGLRAVDELPATKKLELARVLLRTGRVLGRQAFERLSELIRELCIVDVNAVLIRGIVEQVAGEKQFADLSLKPPVVCGEGVPIRIFRTDLQDILVNVIRNSLRSTVLYADPPFELGIDLVTETDEITGHSSLAIRIKDRSPEPLNNEMLRGRYVERGMGITVDLLSRYDGSITVEPEAEGWSKAVVLRFFVLEGETTDIVAEAAA